MLLLYNIDFILAEYIILLHSDIINKNNIYICIPFVVYYNYYITYNIYIYIYNIYIYIYIYIFYKNNIYILIRKHKTITL